MLATLKDSCETINHNFKNHLLWERLTGMPASSDIVARLPDNLLAAYMGCTPQNLSRIKSKLYQ
jgi:hypothetical protein